MKTKSPLKDRPLRNPGESVDRELLNLLFDEVLLYISAAGIFMTMALLEWYRWLSDAPPSPFLMSGVALIAIAVAAWKIRKTKPKIEALKLGRDGEKAVAQYLDRLRERGARVFHDVISDGFNVDHVLIDTTGVYVIETKTRSKPERGPAKLVFDGATVRTNGFEPDRNPVIQARAARGWIAELLQESTGKSAPMRAVVLYPGWYIDTIEAGRTSDVWVLNPKALPKYIENAQQRLSSEDVQLFAYHLSRYVRSEGSGK